jgi:glycosyltransferase involved in cell wall biosynthesis
MGRDEGHHLAAWSTFLLRRGGVPARLLLPEPNRQAERALRFGSACGEQAGIAIAPSGTPPLDVLAAGDILVVPGQSLYEPVIVAWAMAGGLPVVTAGVERDPPLLDGLTSLASVDTRPLNLARAMLRVWQDRSLAESITCAARQRVLCLCDSGASTAVN